MSLNLIKLCVGAEKLDDLLDWHNRRAFVWQHSPEGMPVMAVRHVTRNRPRRAEELLDGGSLYWIIKGAILARNEIIELETHEDERGKTSCGIVMRTPAIITMPKLHRSFQGWRYFPKDRAPDDIGSAQKSAEQMPSDLAIELKTRGLL